MLTTMVLWELLLAVFTAVMASSGFWAYLMKRWEKKSSQTKLLLGLGHDRICALATEYIERGSITPDEYENLHDYLYLPYLERGGNGTAKHLMNEVEKLDMHPKKKERAI